MQSEIVRKLNCQLEHGFEREADVIYVMAEVRKLFEHVRTVRKFPVLAFYSNWALHTRIDLASLRRFVRCDPVPGRLARLVSAEQPIYSADEGH